MIALALTWLALQTPITAVEVHGNSLVTESAILHYAGLGEAVSRPELAAAFQRLWDTGLFEDVRFDTEPVTSPQGAGQKLVITVVEKPLLRSLRIEGDRIDEDKIRDGLRRAGFRLEANRAFGESDLHEVQRATERLLGAEFVVTGRLEPVSEQQVDLVLKVERREWPRIESIVFRGNEAIGKDELRDAMHLTTTGFVSKLTHRDRYDRDALDADLERLRDLYRDRGYARASIGPTDVRPDTGNRVAIEIPVVEGELYRFGTLDVEPGSLLTKHDAESFLPEPGARYDASAIDRAVERLRNHYLGLGYPEAHVEREETSVPARGVMNVTLRVVDGRFQRLGFLTFHGHVRHRDRDLRQLVPLVESERLDLRDVDASVSALMSTGDFLAVRPEIELEARPSRGNVDLYVEEKPLFEYLVGGGVTGTQGGTGSGQILTRGLFGRGETLSLNLDLGNRFQNIVVGYRDAATLGHRLFLTADFRRASLVYPDETGEDTTDLALRIGGPLGSKWQALGSFRFSGFTLDSSLPGDVPFLTPFLGMRFQTYRAGAALVYETRDRPVFASRGRRLALGYEGVAGDVAIHEVRIDGTLLLPFGRAQRHVVTLSGRAEALWSYGATVDTGVPRFERFFLGSENDLRGFPIRGVGPRSGAFVVGGDRLVFASAEYRFSPVTRLGFVGFFDVGNVFATDFDGDPVPNLRYDAGAEAQILVPAANLPLRIGYGFNLDPLPDEPKGRLFVSLAVRF